MKIELTDQQEQAVKQGCPVEVLDPASERVFVLLIREQYERVRALLEVGREQGPPSPVLPPALSAGQGKTPRVCLRDLPTPPELAVDIEREAKKRGIWRKKYRQQLEDEFKLQYYYGGQSIYVLRSDKGPVVVPIEDRYKGMPDLRYVLLTPDERSRACLEVPSRWRDTIAEILS